MEEKFFTKDFDFKKYINRQILEIDDEQTRKEIKEAVKNMLIPFYEYAEESYRQLEENFRKEKDTKKEVYQMILGICRRDQIDTTDEVMHPMQSKDTEKTHVSSNKLIEAMEQKKALRLFTVYVEQDVLEIEKLLQEKRQYQGTIKTEYGEYEAIFSLRKNTEYLQQIEEVYRVFVENGKPWRTVPEMYLHKMFDVYLEKGMVPAEEKILDVKIDFQEWNSYIHYDYVPIWNVAYDACKTSAYPELCIDKINYIHTIFGEKLQKEKEYLVVNAEDMKYAYRKGEDFIIVCEEEKPVTWKLLSFCYGETTYENYGQALFHSGVPTAGKIVRTKSEVQRLVKTLEMDKYLNLTGIKTEEKGSMEVPETYEMDAFVADEIRMGGNRDKLIFDFTPKDTTAYLNRDIMSYIVSRLQWEIPEYQCIGRLR